MVIPAIRILALPCCLATLLLSLAIPATADIDVSILRSATKGTTPAASAAKPAAAGAGAVSQVGASTEGSPDDWFRRATELDRPNANTTDLASAAHWYRKAAEKGNTDAQTRLALMYAEGRGVELNNLEAARWYRKAAEAGDVRAQYALALMYHLGQGVSQDYADAIHWYETAARQGDANSMNNMAFMYGMGEGVSQSNIEAYVWFALAASRGNTDAAENRDLAASEMTPEERRKAKERYTQLEKQLGLKFGTDLFSVPDHC
jgi:TPR repeat protein